MVNPLRWDGNLWLLNQLKLPFEEKWIRCSKLKDVAKGIKDMIIRGAPAIGVAAAYGVALLCQEEYKTKEEFLKKLDKGIELLASTRPTAVNLFWALERMKKIAKNFRALSLEDLKQKLIQEAQTIEKENLECCESIGKVGATIVPEKAFILTHCNAGSLATGGYGTALGVIRKAKEEGKQIHVFVDETRPYLQGARLTMWELMKEEIPATLITDNMAGYMMRKEKIDLVLVGADRITANGDIANKIGTYILAVLAKENGIPFYSAAPTSTLDLTLSSGEDITVEERPPQEVLYIQNKRIAPVGAQVRNPAFDITPSRYVTGIITEKGIVYPPWKENLKKLIT